jgi:hypothetical protein
VGEEADFCEELAQRAAFYRERGEPGDDTEADVLEAARIMILQLLEKTKTQ